MPKNVLCLCMQVRLLAPLLIDCKCCAGKFFLLLPITLPHVLALGELPPHHGDPFDRLLISQARVDNLVLVTKDENISKYPVDVLW